MLCRRCGMESSTTDICEWCKRPMLPAGATISRKAAEEVRQDGSGNDSAGTVAEPPAEREEEGVDLVEDELALASAEEEAPAASEPPEQEEPEHRLRPLGGVQASPQQVSAGSGQPSHGLSDDATQTSIDISQYIGDDQSIFRPQKRPEPASAMPGGGDPLAQRRAGTQQSGPTSEISENTRLVRCLIAGLVVSTIIALIQYAVTGETVLIFYVLRLGRGPSLMVAIKYGLASGLVLGLGLGAILVRLRKGPFLGMLIGLLVAVGFKNAPWALIAGALTGIVAGRLATVGLRQQVTV
jgi:hypothetical protein